MTAPRILALDPAPLTGFAHSNGRHGVWRLSIASEEHRGNRLARLYDHVEEVYHEWGIDKLVFENASMGAGKYMQAIVAHNEIRGVLILLAARFKIPWYVVNPTSLKKFATGNGHAEKHQMIRAAKVRLGVDVASDDEADAIWILAMAEANEIEEAKRKQQVRATREANERQRERKFQEKLF